LSVVVFRIGLAIASRMQDQAYGSTLAPGRWHSLRNSAGPLSVIYTSGSRALAQLEKRVHANGFAPAGQALFRVVLPDGSEIPRAEALGLPRHWRDSEAVTQAFGDRWLASVEHLALWVPSYVEPAEYNLLINAGHRALSAVTLTKERDPFEFDPRLM
jgi:RES domain-containing protein